MKQETLDKLHTTQVEMLDVIHTFCQEYNLTYYLACGTLLGAVRHQGFIPWDDDIDIAMPRKDYDFLLANIQSWVQDTYFLQTAYTDAYYGRSYAKLRKRNTIFLEAADANVEGRHHEIFLDIFPIEDSHKTRTGWDKLKYKLYQFVDSYIVSKRGCLPITGVRKLLRVFPMKLLLKVRDKAQRGKGEYWFLHWSGISPRSDYEPAKLLPFEGKNYMVPNQYHKLLTNIYGDYMQLPPVEKRVTHNPVRLSFDTTLPDEEL